jgi:hypothetical protein
MLPGFYKSVFRLFIPFPTGSTFEFSGALSRVLWKELLDEAAKRQTSTEQPTP